MGWPPADLPGLPEPIDAAFVSGTEGDDRLVLELGATAAGGGGADVFVLSPGGGDAARPLATLLDFGEDDVLDLSSLGDAAAILGTVDVRGGQRISIDYDGDGAEDGHVLVLDGQGHVGDAPGEIAPVAAIFPELSTGWVL